MTPEQILELNAQLETFRDGYRETLAAIVTLQAEAKRLPGRGARGEIRNSQHHRGEVQPDVGAGQPTGEGGQGTRQRGLVEAMIATNQRQQERHIAACRELLQPIPVRPSHVPGWLARRIRQRLGIRGCADALLHRALALAGFTVDHWGSIDGGQRFVSEPYPEPNDLAGAERFAALLGLRLKIDANSWWYPGFTLRLTFTLPRGD